MARLPQIRARELRKILLKHGFQERHGKGSHRVFTHVDGRRTVVAFHNKPLTKGTVGAILRQAGLDWDVLV